MSPSVLTSRMESGRACRHEHRLRHVPSVRLQCLLAASTSWAVTTAQGTGPRASAWTSPPASGCPSRRCRRPGLVALRRRCSDDARHVAARRPRCPLGGLFGRRAAAMPTWRPLPPPPPPSCYPASHLLPQGECGGAAPPAESARPPALRTHLIRPLGGPLQQFQTEFGAARLVVSQRGVRRARAPAPCRASVRGSGALLRSA
mmetsp:Transcript_37720/g.112000  ORF Transcript_37720/g.112000 Transcript_37720/m.112000 type:complete len:203 (-) Transcript_37720:59-667(-)